MSCDITVYKILSMLHNGKEFDDIFPEVMSSEKQCHQESQKAYITSDLLPKTALSLSCNLPGQQSWKVSFFYVIKSWFLELSGGCCSSQNWQTHYSVPCLIISKFSLTYK